MGKETEYGTKLRLLRVMMAILERPNGYTKRELAERYNTSLDTIKKDIEALRNAGFDVVHDSKYRYHFEKNDPHRKLKELLHFTEEDQ
ncbi:MAG: HTH domain-containing protein, partial [Bacteroidetes bacterium]|nr:HTH domain-containing protein [Bacteroidota bacterium]